MKSTEKQFLEAYDAHSEAIYRHCYFRVFSKERAEELVQDTFRKAWQYLSEGKDVKNIRALLYRIATNLIIDDSRKRKEESLEGMLENDATREPGDRGHLDMENKVLWKQVLAEMSTLDEDERALLVMRFVDDLDPKEIAEVLETNANNISVKISRAVKKLKIKIQ